MSLLGFDASASGVGFEQAFPYPVNPVDPVEKSYPLKLGQVHVWYASLDRSQAEIAEFERMLSLEELDRARRFQKVAVRGRYVARRGILRRLLSQYLRCEPSKVEILQDRKGKPHLSARINPDNLQFSESDSDNMAAYAFSIAGSIGIDIEKVRDFSDMLELVNQHFTQREKDEVFSCPEDLRLMLFYRLWTRKEAVLKAQGEGLLRELGSVDVSTGGSSGPWKIKFNDREPAGEYVLADIECPPGFAAAVAVAAPAAEVSIQNHMI